MVCHPYLGQISPKAAKRGRSDGVQGRGLPVRLSARLGVLHVRCWGGFGDASGDRDGAGGGCEASGGVEAGGGGEAGDDV